MRSFQISERTGNGVQIMEIMQMPAPAAGERIDLSAVDDIDIGFRLRGKTRIEALRNRFNRTDADILRQKTVQRLVNFPFRDVAIRRRRERTSAQDNPYQK